MTWSKKRYEEMLKNMLPYVDATKMKQYVDLRALTAYANSKGVSVSELSNEEKRKFVFDRTPYSNDVK